MLRHMPARPGETIPWAERQTGPHVAAGRHPGRARYPSPLGGAVGAVGRGRSAVRPRLKPYAAEGFPEPINSQGPRIRLYDGEQVDAYLLGKPVPPLPEPEVEDDGDLLDRRECAALLGVAPNSWDIYKRDPVLTEARVEAGGVERWPRDQVPAAKAAAETGILAVHPKAVVARTSLIIGHGLSVHERLVHELAAGTTDGALAVHRRHPLPSPRLGPAAALLELADGSAAGIHHVTGPDALSRHQLGVLTAERDGLDASRLSTGLRADSTTPGPLDIRLDSQATQRHLRTRLRGARDFLSSTAAVRHKG